MPNQCNKTKCTWNIPQLLLFRICSRTLHTFENMVVESLPFLHMYDKIDNNRLLHVTDNFYSCRSVSLLFHDTVNGIGIVKAFMTSKLSTEEKLILFSMSRCQNLRRAERQYFSRKASVSEWGHSSGVPFSGGTIFEAENLTIEHFMVGVRCSVAKNGVLALWLVTSFD